MSWRSTQDSHCLWLQQRSMWQTRDEKKKKSRLYMHSFSLKSRDGRRNISCLLGNHFLPGNFIKCSSFKSWTKFLNWRYKPLVWATVVERTTVILKSNEFILVSPCSATWQNCSTWQQNPSLLLLFFLYASIKLAISLSQQSALSEILNIDLI